LSRLLDRAATRARLAAFRAPVWAAPAPVPGERAGVFNPLAAGSPSCKVLVLDVLFRIEGDRRWDA